MASTNCLLALGDHVLSLIVRHLVLADKIRLSLVSRELCLFCRKSISCLLLKQQDLEESDAFSVYPHVQHVHLYKIDLYTELMSFLAGNSPAELGQLRSIHITDPSNLNSSATTLLLGVCTGLTSLTVHGDWQPDPQNSMSEQYARNLQRLALQQNAQLSTLALKGLLTGPVDVPANRVLECSLQREWRCRPPPSIQQYTETVWKPLTHWLAAAGDYLLLQQDPAIESIRPAWAHLQELDLSGCSGLGDDWTFLALCPELRSLKLHSCFQVTSHTIKRLHDILQDYSSSRGSCSSRKGCSTAEACSNASASNDFWPYSSRTSPFAAAAVQETVAAQAAAATQAAATRVESAVNQAVWGKPIGLRLVQLDLAYTRVNDRAMLHLAAVVPGLQWLSLKGCNVSDDGLLHLLQLRQLTALHIKHCHRITEEGMLQLSGLSGLRELSFGYTSMPEADDVAAAMENQFKGLTGLNLLSIQLTDKGLAALGKLQHLQQLKLYQAGITCNGLSGFAEQPAGKGLSSLVLYGLGRLTSLECLGAFPQLQDLQLGCMCDLEDTQAALQQLTSIKHLTSLVLERLVGISVATLRRILSGSRQLVNLRIRGCDGVSQDDIEQLAAKSAAWCRSSASIWWTGSSSIDTDDEEEGDTLLCS